MIRYALYIAFVDQHVQKPRYWAGAVETRCKKCGKQSSNSQLLDLRLNNLIIDAYGGTAGVDEGREQRQRSHHSGAEIEDCGIFICNNMHAELWMGDGRICRVRVS